MKADDFLNTVSSIGVNQAEYSILSRMPLLCKNYDFLLELKDLGCITHCFQDTVNYIHSNYKSFELRIFCLDDHSQLSYAVLDQRAGSSFKIEELYNIAIRQSKDNASYVLVSSQSTCVLFYNGEFDKEFENTYADKQKLIEAELRKFNIDQLKQVFERFHVDRKYSGCDYIIDGKVSNSINEQLLRNHLLEYLTKETNMLVVAELCTSRQNDEESVDISVIDKNKAVSIIEVKYFVAKGLFVDPQKPAAYSFSRFSDGYQQLDRYCTHLDQDNYSLHSAYLYMFYAHNCNHEKVEKKAKEKLDSLFASSTLSEHFCHHYKDTICDDILAS